MIHILLLPKVYSTDVLTSDQLEFVAKRLPTPKASTGRPAYTNLELLGGILYVLRSGCRWRDLNRKDHPSGITHWRRLRFWEEQQGIERVWKLMLKLLLKERKLILKQASIDGSLFHSYAFKDTTSYDGFHRAVGTKISAVVDESGTPLSRIERVGSENDWIMAKPTIENIPPKLKKQIQKMLADKGYANSHMRAYLHSLGINPDIPEKEDYITWRQKINLMSQGGYKRKNQSSNPNRFVVERSFAWTKSFRRLKFRFDYTLLSFTAFLNLAFVVICIRKLLP